MVNAKIEFVNGTNQGVEVEILTKSKKNSNC